MNLVVIIEYGFAQTTYCLFLGGVGSLLTELLAVAGMLFTFTSFQWILPWLFDSGFINFGLIMSLF